MTFAPPPPQLDPATLGDARPLSLCLVPTSPAALALIEQLAKRVEAHQAQTRKTVRRAAGQAKLQRAVGAIVGALLTS